MHPKNPAYAGAFAYGQRIADPSRQCPRAASHGVGSVSPATSGWPWSPDVYPAYISWAEYERIQHEIAENRQKMAERLTREAGDPPWGGPLTGLVRCGVCGHAMRVAYKDNRIPVHLPERASQVC